MVSWGADAITLGNHAWKQEEIITFMKDNPDHNLIRPLNFTEDSPGQGYKIFTHSNGERILVSQVHGKTFIDLPLSNPFEAIDTKLLSIINDHQINYSFLEVHAEVTSEKNGIAHSSRNLLLSTNEKKIAARVYKFLLNKKKLISRRIISSNFIKKKIYNLGVNKIDYIEILDINKILHPYKKKIEYKIFIAYYLGKTRLIDNF